MARSSRQLNLNLAEKRNSDSAHNDEEELFEDNEFASQNDIQKNEANKRDSRRKIEIYWEKKQLRDLFEDFDDSELDF